MRTRAGLQLVARIVHQSDGKYKVKEIKELVDVTMITSGLFTEELSRMEEAAQNVT